jgi:hypothetical protein
MGFKLVYTVSKLVTLEKAVLASNKPVEKLSFQFNLN